jgi:hypothetical protein
MVEKMSTSMSILWPGYKTLDEVQPLNKKE